MFAKKFEEKCSENEFEHCSLHSSTKYLGLLRRANAIMLADAGADITALKRNGGWRSSTVAEGYVNNSMTNKKDVAKNNMLGESHSEPVASKFHKALEMLSYVILPRAINPMTNKKDVAEKILGESHSEPVA